jgi:hypothetical protein
MPLYSYYPPFLTLNNSILYSLFIMFFLFEALLFTALPLVIVHLIWNVSRLKSTGVSGPFLAGFTDLWRNHMMKRGDYMQNVQGLHQKYGKLVRLGPNYISCNDPLAVPTIYGTNPVWNKVRWSEYREL